MPFLRTSTGHMLQIDELLQVAGDEKLGGFVWGNAVCEEMGQYLSKERQITPETTGNEAIAKIRALPITAVLRIGVMYVNPKTGEIRYIDDPTDTDTNEESHPTEKSSQSDDKRTVEPDDQKPPNEEETLHGKIMMMIASTVVIIALILTFNVISPKNKGTEVKSSTLEVALQVLGEIFGSTANTAGNGQNNDYQDNPDYPNNPPSNQRDNGSDPVNRPPRSDDPGPQYGN